MADSYLCRSCSKVMTATKNSRYRSHTDGNGEPCVMSSEAIPEDLLAQGPLDGKAPKEVPAEGQDFGTCPHCQRKVQLTAGGAYWPHQTTLRGGEKCPNSGMKFQPLKPTEDVPLPGDSPPDKSLYSVTHPKVSAQMEVDQERIGVPRVPSAILTSGPDGVADLSAYTEPAGPTHPVVAAAVASGAVSPKTRDETYEANMLQQPMDPEAAMQELIDLRQEMEASVPSAGSGASTESSSPESASTSNNSLTPSGGSESEGTVSSLPTTPSPASTGPFKLGKKLSEAISQPWSPFLQPPEWSGTEKPEPMGDYAKELATRIKETFYSYSNRKSVDNRGAQTTLGPSEIGTPCDRRLAMTLLGVPAVNPGGDGWASFVGTCGHVGMGEVYKFADAGTGRYAVEFPVLLGIPSVPRGTSDLLDRRDGTILDWKFMGAYSLKKFKLEGPSETYRVQAHTYGLGAKLAGEVVRNVAIVGLPRAGSSLDDMHVWTEKFDPKVGQAALDRVQRIAAEVEKSNTEAGLDVQVHSMRRAKRFPTADACRYCPFHLKNDKEMVRGCPGF